MEVHAGIRAEWDSLRSVMVHEPGVEVFFALLAPSAHLYERFFSLTAAQEEHRALCRMLEADFGVRVYRLGPALTEGAERDQSLFEELERFAQKRAGRRSEAERCDLSRRIRTEFDSPLPFRERDPAHLLTIALLNPSSVLTCDGVRTELARPFHNLYFMRDQQATGAAGVTAARMAQPEREGETELTGLGLRALGIEVVHEVTAGHFEGGDFLPCNDAVLIGCGARTDREGAFSILSGPGMPDEAALVHQPAHPLIHGTDPMVCMHLDTYLNFAADGVAVGNPDLLRAAGTEVLHREDEGYVITETTTLDAFLAEKGMEVVPVSTLEQLCYACNFLTVRGGECITPDTRSIAPLVLTELERKRALRPGIYGKLAAKAHKDYEDLKRDHAFFPDRKRAREFGLEMHPADLSHATGGYGGAHCMTCALNRG